MSVVARSDDGRWSTVRQLGVVPQEEARALLDGDVSTLLELDEPTWILATSPPLAGSPDALAITPSGELVLIMVVADAAPTELVRRIVDLGADLRGRSSAELLGWSDRLGLQHTPGSWIASLTGVDAFDVDARLEHNLADGQATLLLLACAGHRQIALAMHEAAIRSRLTLRCHELTLLGTDWLRMVEAWEVTRLELARAARAARRDADEQAMLDATEASLGPGPAARMQAVVRYADAFFAKADYGAVGDSVVIECCIDDFEDAPALLQVSSAGALDVDLASLHAAERALFLQALEGILDPGHDSLVGDPTRTVRVSLDTDLTDESLVHVFLGALSDAILGTMREQLEAVPGLRRVA